MAARPTSRSKSPAPAASARPTPETIDPRWLLRAALAAVLVAGMCAYVTICIVFSRTQWQLVLHPLRSVERTPAALSLPFEEVRFGPGSDGQPELHGWWIPSGEPSTPVALLLHDGTGTMANALPLAAALHRARMSVLLFDYRGFGKSAGAHPTQFMMEQDTDAALSSLRSVRHFPLESILPVGQGLGASLAVRLASAHKQIPAIILSSPAGDLDEQAGRATQSRLVPFKLLFEEHFPLGDALHQLATPKLILEQGSGRPPVIAQRAADPKMTVEGLQGDGPALDTSLRRFFDTYVARPVQELRPAVSGTR